MKRQVVDKVMWEIRGVRPNMVGTVGTLLHERNHDATLILQLGSSYASMYSVTIITLPAPALNKNWVFEYRVQVGSSA